MYDKHSHHHHGEASDRDVEPGLPRCFHGRSGGVDDATEPGVVVSDAGDLDGEAVGVEVGVTSWAADPTANSEQPGEVASMMISPFAVKTTVVSRAVHSPSSNSLAELATWPLSVEVEALKSSVVSSFTVRFAPASAVRAVTSTTVTVAVSETLVPFV